MPIIAGNTEIEKYTLRGQDLWFKREDYNPSGSFKDRLIAYLWPRLLQASYPEIVLSSSGNMAISLLYWQIHSQKKLGSKLRIFVADNLPESKELKLSKFASQAGALIIKSAKPKSQAISYSKTQNAFLLRGSEVDEYADSYHSLADEIVAYQVAQNFPFSEIFICCSSATAAQGLLEGLLTYKTWRHGKVFLVQTSHINPFAKEFDADFSYESETKANAIADRIARRKPRVLELLAAMQGSGVVVSNVEIEQGLASWRELFPTSGNYTGNTVLSLAGMLKLRQKGYNFAKPLIIVSGN